MSTILILERYSYTSTYTEGKLYRPTEGGMRRIAYTIERPWKGNARNISCIPEGRYDIRLHTRPNGDRVYMLLGNGCCAEPSQLSPPHITRWGILIHAANYPDQVEGCIAPGLARDRGSVQQSRAAMNAIRAELTPYFSMATYGVIEIRPEVLYER